jgi:hypothetical protein
VTTAHAGVPEALPNSYRQLTGSTDGISQTSTEALCQTASSHAGSLSDRPEAFAGTCCEGSEPSSHA